MTKATSHPTTQPPVTAATSNIAYPEFFHRSQSGGAVNCVTPETNIIAFRPKATPPAPRPGDFVARPLGQPNRWAKTRAVNRIIAEVAAEPAHGLVESALVSLQLATFGALDELSMACTFKAMLRLCRALETAGFPVPAFGGAK
jgi:hypothetical protein